MTKEPSTTTWETDPHRKETCAVRGNCHYEDLFHCADGCLFYLDREEAKDMSLEELDAALIGATARSLESHNLEILGDVLGRDDVKNLGFKPGWHEIGTIGVDAGLCWIGDPCYIIESEQARFETWDAFLDELWSLENRGYPKVAKFPHALGHDGLGICTSTGFGDGVYPVYAKIVESNGWGKRIAELRVVFIEDEEEDE